MKIILETYNANWKSMFEEEREVLLKKFVNAGLSIEHIGSTAVEGLMAKPVIDILVGVNDFSGVDTLIPGMEKLGYSYISKYEDVMPGRRFFIKEKEGIRTHHVHMVQKGDDFWTRHLFFRDHLRNDSVAKEKYQELKMALANREWNNGDEYASAKNDFIRSIEKRRG